MPHRALAAIGRAPTVSAGGSTDRLRRFLQYGHIFTSAVQDILESRYLAEASPEPLTVQQFHLLKLIAARGEHQVGEVAECLGVSSPAVSKNIDKLEGMGLVSRSASAGDRRVTLISVRPGGRDLVRRYERLKAERLAPVLATFAPEEIDQLTRLLERFARRLFDSGERGGSFCLRCAAYGSADCALIPYHANCPYADGRAGGARPSDEEVPIERDPA